MYLYVYLFVYTWEWILELNKVFFGPYAATQLALQVQQELSQVVCRIEAREASGLRFVLR